MTLSPPTVALRDLLQRNAFRLLGLPGEATWSQIAAAAAAHLLGRSQSNPGTPWDLPWLGRMRRDPGDIDAALARLAEPELRLLDRLFWFHEREAETAVAHLAPGSIRDALEGWSATSLPVRRHDAAIVTLVAASSLDAGMEDFALWHRAVREWTDLVENEGYWLAFMKAELAGGFERLASLGDIRDLRENALGYVTDVVVSAARESLAAGKPGPAIRAVELLRDELPPEVFEEMCGDLARVLEVEPPVAPKGPEPRAWSEPAQHAPSDNGMPWWASREDGAKSEAAPRAEQVPEPAIEPAPVLENDQAAPVEPAVDLPPAPHAPSENGMPWWASREDGAKSEAAPRAEQVLEPAIEPAPVLENDQAAPVEPAVELPPAPWMQRSMAARPPAVSPAASPHSSERTPVVEAPVSPVERKSESPTPKWESPAKWERPSPMGRTTPGAGTIPRRVARGWAAPSSAAIVQKAGIGLLAVAIGLMPFLLLPFFANGSSDNHAWVLDVRAELNDVALAKLQRERAENDRVRDSLLQDLTESHSLLGEYQSRIDRGLPHDPVAYLRLQSYYNATQAHYQEVLQKDRDLSERYDLRLRRRGYLFAERN